jgi:hypothetical protein
MMLASFLLAQTQPSQPATSQPSAADDRATEFKAVEGDTGEHYSGYSLMVEAYAAIWLILMLWLVFLWRKQADLTARMSGLEAAIVRAERRAVTKVKPSPVASVPPKQAEEESEKEQRA